MKKILLPVFALLLLLSGCTEETKKDPIIEPDDITYTVSFETFDGPDYEDLIVLEKTAVTLPADPTLEGYAFGGWFTDNNCTITFNGVVSIEKDIKLYAKWNPIRTIITAMYEENSFGGFYIFYDVSSNLNTLTFKNYDFLGWYSDAEYQNEITSVTGTLEAQTIYMKLEPKEFNLSNEDEIVLDDLPYASYLRESNPVVTIKVKDIGEMTLQLFPDVAQNTVDNFINYIQSESYTDSTFHRIIEDFMIQGGIVSDTECAIHGDFTSNGFDNELQHYRGVLSMARTSVVDSATSQFFIVHEDSHFLDENYATFGALTSGFNVLDYIATVDTLSSDAPFAPVVIESITIDLNGYEVTERVCYED